MKIVVLTLAAASAIPEESATKFTGYALVLKRENILLLCKMLLVGLYLLF